MTVAQVQALVAHYGRDLTPEEAHMVAVWEASEAV